MITTIPKNCPHCGRLRKNHTRWQKEACGRAMSANPINQGAEPLIVRADLRKN